MVLEAERDSHSGRAVGHPAATATGEDSRRAVVAEGEEDEGVGSDDEGL